jgi:hypothetical protein
VIDEALDICEACDVGCTSDPGAGVGNDGDGEAARGGIDGGAYDTGPGGMAAGAVGGASGASSGIFAVGASWRMPQPPQNRESGAFSVPQLAQRIPPSA